VLAGAPDATPIPQPAGAPPQPLGALRDLVEVTPGERLAYLTDLADTPANRAAAIALARDADTLFIEAPFAAADAAHALDRRHLTTQAAGEIARDAGARRIEPFHFSPRYEDAEARLLAEVFAAAGRPLPH
jgi:ribonuclease Z